MSAHTDGRWLLDWNVGRIDVHCDGKLIASLRRSTIDGPPTYDDGEALANARLIAAAPELLAALQEAIDAVHTFHGPVAWETYRDHSPEMKRWRDAIAKATGSAA